MDWYVYIISKNAHTLCTGMTNNLPKRIDEHKRGVYENAFTARYTFDRCVYFEVVKSQSDAARREKQIKGWSRAKRIALIQAENPNWRDLSTSWTESLCLH